jgi:hypothetical protein
MSNVVMEVSNEKQKTDFVDSGFLYAVQPSICDRLCGGKLFLQPHA